jgi:phosphopantothenoylcysteine decarboxylase/phosphopantothenate--cysteine ligase
MSRRVRRRGTAFCVEWWHAKQERKLDFSGKTIALAVTGSIAAYRTCDLIRELYRLNALRVMVLLSQSATEFVTPLSLQILSREAVHLNDLSVNEQGVPIHIATAQDADVLVVVPCTANMLARLAHGLADDLVSTTAISFTDKPMVIVPAMNTRMWRNPLTKKNVELLSALPNVTVITPISGNLACGETGDGHLADQSVILQYIYRQLHPQAGLFNRMSAIVTAGGTREPLDPVRTLTNRSSGKMGLALADELFGMGASVTLITTQAPANSRPYPVVTVDRADEMRIAIENRFSSADLLLMSAAVSDYRVEAPAKQKIKRGEGPLILELAPNTDILAQLSKQKRPDQVVVGFAAETEHLLAHAREKLERKNLDLVVANDISREDIGFNHEFNEVTLLFRDKEQTAIPRGPKTLVARELLTVLHRKLLAGRKKRPRPEAFQPFSPQ